MSTRRASAAQLKEVAESTAEEKNWEFSEGFIVGNKKTYAPFLHGKPLLPTEALTDDGIDESAIGVVEDTHFKHPVREEVFLAPLILIKEHESLPMGFWDKSSLAYKYKIVGIHADESQIEELREVYRKLTARKRLYQFCCALNGSQALVGKATAILKQDIDALPYPESDKDLDLSFWEQALVDDVLDYIAPFVRLGQKSDLLVNQAKQEQMTAYADMFCRMLGTVYKNLQSSEPVYTNGLICQPFYFGRCPKINWHMNGHKERLERLIYRHEHKSMRTVRIVRFYSDNIMLIVKPDRLRYWIRSTAIRDADETLLDLRRQGY